MTNPASRRARRLPMRNMVFSLEGIVERVELYNVRTKKTDLVLDCYPRKNLIVDAGLDGIGNGVRLTNLISYMGVGTDNTTPAAAQTSLLAPLGARSNSNGGFADSVAYNGTGSVYWQVTRTRVIAAGVATGNLTEFGFFSGLTGGTMWMRQLFLSGGTPTTVTKAADQELRVTYTWRIYIQTTTSVTSISIGGVSTDCTVRAMDVDNDAYWGSTGCVMYLGFWAGLNQNARAYESDTFPTTTGGDFDASPAEASSLTYSTYSNGNFYRDATLTFEPSVANFTTGIGSVAFTPWSSFSRALGMTFSPKVAKDNTYRFTQVIRVTWARH